MTSLSWLRMLGGMFLVLVTATFAVAQANPEKSNAQINSALDSFFGANGTTTVDPNRARQVDNAQFSYTRNPAISREVDAQVLSVFGADANAQARRELQAFVDQLTPEFRQQIMDDGFPNQGWRADNLADVAAATVIVGFAVLQDLEDTTAEQDEAVRNLVRVALDNSDLTRLSNDDKQQFTEFLFVSTILTVLQSETAREQNNLAFLNDLKSATSDSLASFGLHPELFVLGAEGLEKSARLKQLEPQINDGSVKFEDAFPRVVADYERLGAALPAAQTASVPANNTATAQTQSQSATKTNPLGTPPAATAAGKYDGDGLTLVLETDGAAHIGVLASEGANYPVILTGEPPVLSGTFEVEGTKFDLVVQIEGETLLLETGGAKYTLQKEQEAPKNPLAKN